MSLLKCLTASNLVTEQEAISLSEKAAGLAKSKKINIAEAEAIVKNEFVNSEYKKLHTDLINVKKEIYGKNYDRKKEPKLSAIPFPDLKEINKEYQENKANSEEQKEFEEFKKTKKEAEQKKNKPQPADSAEQPNTTAPVVTPQSTTENTAPAPREKIKPKEKTEPVAEKKKPAPTKEFSLTAEEKAKQKALPAEKKKQVSALIGSSDLDTNAEVQQKVRDIINGTQAQEQKEAAPSNEKSSGVSFNSGNDSALKTKVVAQAKNVVKALKKFMPDLQVVIYDTDAEQIAAIGDKIEGDNKRTRGAYDPDTNIIHINLESIARALGNKGVNNTVFHEGFHPVLNALVGNMGDVNNKNRQRVTQLYNQVKALSTSTPQVGSVIRFGERYRKDKTKLSKEQLIQNQQLVEMETVVEFISQVATGDIKIKPSNKTAIINIINRFLKMINSSTQLKLDANISDVREFANAIKKSFTTGADITESTGIAMSGKGAENQFQFVNAVFETRDGKRIGFNYDTDQVARERFDISKLKKIGSGSDRDVYDLGDGKVLKIAKTARGLTQNISEGDGMLSGSIIPEAHERGLNYVVVDNAPRLKASDKVTTYDVDGDEIGTATAGEMLKEFQQFSATDFKNHTGKIQDALTKYGFNDLLSYDVLWGDFTAQRNWGYKDGKALHTDAGTFGGGDWISSHKGVKNLSDPEFREIYNKSRALKKEFGDTDKNTMYQIIGEKGAKNIERVRNNLSVAREMEAAGKTPKEIWDLTGWQKSKDNDKWKYDLPDFVIKNSSELEAAIKQKEKTSGEFVSMKLSALVDGDFLEAYPEAKTLLIELVNEPKNKNYAEYEKAKNQKTGETVQRIFINIHDRQLERFATERGLHKVGDLLQKDWRTRSVRNLLIHEVQHFIQEKEGFAKGGSTSQFKDAPIPKQLKDTHFKWFAGMKIFTNKLQKLGQNEYGLFQIADLEKKSVIKFVEAHPELKADFDRLSNEGRQFDKYLTKEKKYHNLAGESEARNAEDRANMTPEERKAKMLSETEDVADEDKIYLYDDEAVAEKVQQQLAEDNVTSPVNIAPLYSTRVSSQEQADKLISSPMYQAFLKEATRVAELMGLKVEGHDDGIGGFDGTPEVTSVMNVTGNFEDIKKYAALMGALTPEVQVATIAGVVVEEKSKNHNADRVILGIDNKDAALKAATDAGFLEDGFTMVGDTMTLVNPFVDNPIKDFDEKIDIFANKLQEYGGTIKSEEREAIQSEYIDYSKREAVIAEIEGDAVQYEKYREGIRDVITTAKERNAAFTKWQERLESPELKEYQALRQKQLDDSELSPKERQRIRELETQLSEPLAAFFSTDQKLYEQAKAEVEAVANDIAELIPSAFVSQYGVKKPARAAIKSVRWYSYEPNQLGDGARVNVIVDTDGDADFLYKEIGDRYVVGGIDRQERFSTELGYPKRLSEIKTPSGKIAEIQVMTPQGYLAKEGVKDFPEDRKDFAKSILTKIQDRLGWGIPDGVGHYFYEVNRDTNVPKKLRDEAQAISKKYYDAFLNENSNLTDQGFRQDAAAFKNKVDAADKSDWDASNKAVSPVALDEYLNESESRIQQQLPEAESEPKSFVDWGKLPSSAKEDIADQIYNSSEYLKKNYNPNTFREYLDGEVEFKIPVVELDVDKAMKKVSKEWGISESNLKKVREFNKLHPVISNKGNFYDGGHRILVAKERGQKKIDAYEISHLLNWNWEAFDNNEKLPEYNSKGQLQQQQPDGSETKTPSELKTWANNMRKHLDYSDQEIADEFKDAGYTQEEADEALGNTSTPQEVAAKIKNDEVNYDDAIKGKDQDFIDKLNKELFGSKKFNINEDGFRTGIKRQKDYGIPKEDIITDREASKRLTKREREIIEEVFGETADTDRQAAELQEAFKQLAKGEKPKSVLKRLSASDVTNLVKAMNDALLRYKAISNVQLSAMADYIVDSIDLNKSDAYLNAMASNSLTDVKQLVRAKLIIALEGKNDALATQLVRDMADEATSFGRATQSLVEAYRLLNAKGSPKVRTAFARKYAEAVQAAALKKNQHMAEVISDKDVEIAKLNEKIHNAAQKNSGIGRIRQLIDKLCGTRKN